LTVFVLLVALHSASAAAQTREMDEESAVRAAIDHVAPSIVQIRTIGGLEEVERTLLPTGPTTGVIISPDGWILSSSFNFVQQPASILVTFANGEQAPATLVAKDHSRMLVLLKAQGVNDLPVPQVVPADEIRVGQWAIAVGRTFRTDRPNLSVGIVSALDRMFGKVMQTDADVSTANYGGPLVDIRGRVFGVIVPIAPQSTSEVAGAEWYDSGIGFAVPLATLDRAIERMKRGEDQSAGLLGIGMAAANAHGEPAELIAVPPNTPAGKAGLRKGDRIVEINGQPIRTQTDLRFALGPLYGGEDVRIQAMRGDEQIERTITLASELEPFRHGFLGLLPVREARVETRDDSDHEQPETATEPAPNAEGTAGELAGVRVRAVYPGSGAASAGMRPGDHIVAIDGKAIKNLGAALEALRGTIPDSKLGVQIVRNGQPLTLEITPTRQPSVVPADLPPAVVDSADGTNAKPVNAVKTSDLKLAEFPETCQIYVPSSYATGRPTGLLLWIHAPGRPPDEKLFAQWREICDRDGLLLVAPTAAEPSRWERTELEYLNRLLERVLADYRVDGQRVVVVGQGEGGAMAYMLALIARDKVTGVASTDGALPRTVKIPPNDPSTRLAIYAWLPSEGSKIAQIRHGLQELSNAGYPVTAVSNGDPAGSLRPEETRDFARWIDTLDRL
jgi:serine protease Do